MRVAPLSGAWLGVLMMMMEPAKEELAREPNPAALHQVSPYVGHDAHVVLPDKG